MEEDAASGPSNGHESAVVAAAVQMQSAARGKLARNASDSLRFLSCVEAEVFDKAQSAQREVFAKAEAEADAEARARLKAAADAKRAEEEAAATKLQAISRGRSGRESFATAREAAARAEVEAAARAAADAAADTVAAQAVATAEAMAADAEIVLREKKRENETLQILSEAQRKIFAQAEAEADAEARARLKAAADAKRAEEEAAATKLQAISRGRSGRESFATAREAAARAEVEAAAKVAAAEAEAKAKAAKEEAEARAKAEAAEAKAARVAAAEAERIRREEEEMTRRAAEARVAAAEKETRERVRAAREAAEAEEARRRFMVAKAAAEANSKTNVFVAATPGSSSSSASQANDDGDDTAETAPVATGVARAVATGDHHHHQAMQARAADEAPREPPPEPPARHSSKSGTPADSSPVKVARDLRVSFDDASAAARQVLKLPAGTLPTGLSGDASRSSPPPSQRPPPSPQTPFNAALSKVQAASKAKAIALEEGLAAETVAEASDMYDSAVAQLKAVVDGAAEAEKERARAYAAARERTARDVRTDEDERERVAAMEEHELFVHCVGKRVRTERSACAEESAAARARLEANQVEASELSRRMAHEVNNRTSDIERLEEMKTSLEDVLSYSSRFCAQCAVFASSESTITTSAPPLPLTVTPVAVVRSGGREEGGGEVVSTRASLHSVSMRRVVSEGMATELADAKDRLDAKEAQKVRGRPDGQKHALLQSRSSFHLLLDELVIILILPSSPPLPSLPAAHAQMALRAQLATHEKSAAAAVLKAEKEVEWLAAHVAVKARLLAHATRQHDGLIDELRTLEASAAGDSSTLAALEAKTARAEETAAAVAELSAAVAEAEEEMGRFAATEAALSEAVSASKDADTAVSRALSREADTVRTLLDLQAVVLSESELPSDASRDGEVFSVTRSSLARGTRFLLDGLSGSACAALELIEAQAAAHRRMVANAAHERDRARVEARAERDAAGVSLERKRAFLEEREKQVEAERAEVSRERQAITQRAHALEALNEEIESVRVVVQNRSASAEAAVAAHASAVATLSALRTETKLRSEALRVEVASEESVVRAQKVYVAGLEGRLMAAEEATAREQDLLRNHSTCTTELPATVAAAAVGGRGIAAVAATNKELDAWVTSLEVKLDACRTRLSDAKAALSAEVSKAETERAQLADEQWALIRTLAQLREYDASLTVATAQLPPATPSNLTAATQLPSALMAELQSQQPDNVKSSTAQDPHEVLDVTVQVVAGAPEEEEEEDGAGGGGGGGGAGGVIITPMAEYMAPRRLFANEDRTDGQPHSSRGRGLIWQEGPAEQTHDSNVELPPARGANQAYDAQRQFLQREELRELSMSSSGAEYELLGS